MIDAAPASKVQIAAGTPPISVELSSILEPLTLQDLFPVHQPLEVELGSGDGSFLVAWASENPLSNFIGVERLLGRMRKLDRKGTRRGLRNLRGVRIESSYFLQYLLPAHSVSGLHVYFPDPWPKRKHRKNRLINEMFPFLAHRVLAQGGKVYLRTDDADYYRQMLAVFNLNPLFESTQTPSHLAAILTDFERGFHARGISTLRTAFTVRGKA